MKKVIVSKEKVEGPLYLWVRMTDNEIVAYAPVFYTTLTDALDALHKDIRKIAKKHGYKPEQVLQISIEHLEQQVWELWENWKEDSDAEQETEV